MSLVNWLQGEESCCAHMEANYVSPACLADLHGDQQWGSAGNRDPLCLLSCLSQGLEVELWARWQGWSLQRAMMGEYTCLVSVKQSLSAKHFNHDGCCVHEYTLVSPGFLSKICPWLTLSLGFMFKIIMYGIYPPVGGPEAKG